MECCLLMPELPDLTVYIDALEARVLGRALEGMRIVGPFLLRTAEPPPAAFQGKTIRRIRRIGKRIAFGFDDEFWAVVHLMIAGRLHWKPPAAKVPGGRRGLMAFDFSHGALLLTEAGTKKRASLHLLGSDAELADLNPGGLEPLQVDFAAFVARLRSANHTLKRALTDPSLFSGVGNAYSDEILHAARLSPTALTQTLADERVERLYTAVQRTLTYWIERLRAETGDVFPDKVTAFREGMAVHGRYGQPCPVCATAVQRIRYADNETNYCPQCQTGGKLLADRSLSKLLKKDWPKTLEEMENRKKRD